MKLQAYSSYFKIRGDNIEEKGSFFVIFDIFICFWLMDDDIYFVDI